jgi:hypothetical protein
MPARPERCELSTEEKDLGRVINPEEEHHEPCRRAVAGTRATSPEIHADRELPDTEEERRDQSAQPDIAPSGLHTGQHFVEKDHEYCHDSQKEKEIRDVQDEGGRWQHIAELVGELGNERGGRERNDQQQAHAKEGAEGKEAIQQIQPAQRSALWPVAAAPDDLEGRLQFREDPRRTCYEKERAADCTQNTGGRAADVLEDGLEGRRRGGSCHVSYLGDDVGLRPRLSVDKADDGHHHE